MEITIKNPFIFGFISTLGAGCASLLIYFVYFVLNRHPIGLILLVLLIAYCLSREINLETEEYNETKE
jgi:hypothetical protein